VQRQLSLVIEEADGVFWALQCALTSPLALCLLVFELVFIVECDAFNLGFGAVLHQGDGPVAFFNHQIAPCHAKLATYERELIGLV
jgi:hypothetical protein